MAMLPYFSVSQNGGRTSHPRPVSTAVAWPCQGDNFLLSVLDFRDPQCRVALSDFGAPGRCQQPWSTTVDGEIISSIVILGAGGYWITRVWIIRPSTVVQWSQKMVKKGVNPPSFFLFFFRGMILIWRDGILWVWKSENPILYGESTGSSLFWVLSIFSDRPILVLWNIGNIVVEAPQKVMLDEWLLGIHHQRLKVIFRENMLKLQDAVVCSFLQMFALRHWEKCHLFSAFDTRAANSSSSW